MGGPAWGGQQRLPPLPGGPLPARPGAGWRVLGLRGLVGYWGALSALGAGFDRFDGVVKQTLGGKPVEIMI